MDSRGLTKAANKAEAKYEEARVDLRVADREPKHLQREVEEGDVIGDHQLASERARARSQLQGRALQTSQVGAPDGEGRAEHARILVHPGALWVV